jgi:hypothetical protein
MERETGRVIFLPIGRTRPRKWSGVISESVGQPNWRWKDSDGSIRRDGFGAVASALRKSAPLVLTRSDPGWEQHL